MNERIKKLRRALNLTQQSFCERIGLKRNSISLVEVGKRNVSDLTIKAICREFNVREEWLRNGTGEMFLQRTLDQEIAAFLGDATSDKGDFRYRLISVLSRMSPDQWALLEQIAHDLADETKKAAP